MELLKPKIILTPQTLYERTYEAWGKDKPPLKPEAFAELPEPEQLGLLNTIASLNPGFWAERVVGINPQIYDVAQQRIGQMVFANIPSVKVRTSEGEIYI